MRQKYIDAIDHVLSKYDPDFAIEQAWKLPSIHEGGDLFQAAGRGKICSLAHDRNIGCLTQVKAGIPLKNEFDPCVACTPELTERIRKDERIPKNYTDIKPTREALMVFAEYQNEIDDYYEELEKTNETEVSTSN